MFSISLSMVSYSKRISAFEDEPSMWNSSILHGGACQMKQSCNFLGRCVVNYFPVT